MSLSVHGKRNVRIFYHPAVSLVTKLLSMLVHIILLIYSTIQFLMLVGTDHIALRMVVEKVTSAVLDDQNLVNFTGYYSKNNVLDIKTLLFLVTVKS